MFAFIHPNFKSESIFDLVVNNAVGIASTLLFSVIIVNRIEAGRRKKQLLFDWVRHSEDLYADLKDHLFSSQTANDLHAKAFVEEAKVLADYLKQTINLIKDDQNHYKIMHMNLMRMYADALVLRMRADKLLDSEKYDEYKSDAVLSSLAAIHMHITNISARMI